MGGCASKPKESDIPDEAPANVEKPQLETGPQDNSNGGESQIKKPLVDLSEPEAAAETAKPTEDKVKASGNNAEDKDVEVTDNTTVVPVNEAEADQSSNAAPTKEEVKSDASLISL